MAKQRSNEQILKSTKKRNFSDGKQNRTGPYSNTDLEIFAVGAKGGCKGRKQQENRLKLKSSEKPRKLAPVFLNSLFWPERL